MTSHAVCPNGDVLLSAALGEATEADLEAHLQDCPTCRRRVEQFRTLVTTLRQDPPEGDAPDTTTDGNADPDPETRPPALGKYLVVGELGRGGQGRVFRGLHPGLDRDVAIKWAYRSVGQDTLDRLNREGKLLAELDHSGVVRVFDVDVHEGRPFLVMEYVRGSDLEQYAAAENLSPHRAAALVARLAHALAHAHARGIIHQDVKPANVLVDEAGRPRLSDFGIAQSRDLWHKDADPAGGGTLDYMAPEQLRDPAAVGPASDLYALGGVLFFLLTGRAPRRPPANPVLAFQEVHMGAVNLAPLSEKNVPRRLVEICRKALDPEPARRYQKAEDMAGALEQFVDRPQVWRRRLLGLAAGLAFLVVGGALFSFLSRPASQPVDPNPAPARPAALAHLGLSVDRGGKRSVLKTQFDLDHLLPLRARDKLGLTASVPAGMKVGLFSVTLSDPGLQVHELKLEPADGRLEMPGLVPLEGSPATELLFLCGSPDRAPRREDVAALLAELSPKKGGSRSADRLRLPDNALLSFQTDKVDEIPLGRIGEMEEDPVRNVAAILDQVRQKLRQKFAFVSGIAFTHVASVPLSAAPRGGSGAGLKIPGPDSWGCSPEEQKRFRAVMDRLLATDLVRKNFPSQFIWPPSVYIQPNSKKIYNAFAGPYARDEASGKYLVRAFITEGYMDKIVQEDSDILAAIMGHELAHITKGHLLNRIVIDLKGLDLRREQEIEADLEGVRIAVAAGYPFRSGIRSAFREWKVLGDYSNFEGIKGTHPPWTERLALLDRNEAKIWKAMSAFQNGYFFLHAEQYQTAASCFQNVADEFPDCAEAWANTGYAKLMHYCDGLDDKELREYGLGQFVAGCFYDRPSSIPVKRGKNKELWEAAVRALQTALKRDANLVMARANLGLAYLVHYDGKKTDQALDYFRTAYNQKDKGLTDLNLAAFLVNYGVADMAKGQAQTAGEKFRLARKILPPFAGPRGSALVGDVALALRYNEALLAAASPDKEGRATAFRSLEDYLYLASPDSFWWTLAYDRYDKLGRELNLNRIPRDTLAKRFGGKRLRVVASVEVSPGKLVTLSEPAAKVLKLLGREKSPGVPAYYRSKVKRYYAAAPGIDLLAGDTVLAVFLTNDKAPPVYVQGRGAGAKKQELRVGMSVRELNDLLKDQGAEQCYIDDPALAYVFVPDLGLSFRFADGLVREIVLAQVPRKQGY